MEYKTIKNNFKSDQYEMSGYASVFNILDEQNDVVCKGAFSKSIEEFNNKKPKLLWQHDPQFPIGVIEEMFEDDYGLFIKCKLIPGIQKSEEVFTMLKCGAIEGLSIGYKVKEKNIVRGKRYISNLELLEISVVTFPACPEALVKEIKSYGDLEKIMNLLKSIAKKIEFLNLK